MVGLVHCHQQHLGVASGHLGSASRAHNAPGVVEGARRDIFIEGIVAEGQGEGPDGVGSALTRIANAGPCPSSPKPNDTPESSTTVMVISALMPT